MTTSGRTRTMTRTSTTTSTTSTTATTSTTSTTLPPTTVAATAVPAAPDAAPPSTAPAAAPTTALPPRPPQSGDPCIESPIPRYAFGDSVMLGAAGQLAGAGFCVDAVVSRAFVNGLQQVIDLHTANRLGPVVVVALGTNGPIDEAQLGQMMGQLAGVPLVAVVTTKADRGYVPGNNDKLRSLPSTFPNVRLVDWAAVAPSCPGNCFYDDGIHLRPDGRVFYAQQITAVTG